MNGLTKGECEELARLIKKIKFRKVKSIEKGVADLNKKMDLEHRATGEQMRYATYLAYKDMKVPKFAKDEVRE